MNIAAFLEEVDLFALVPEEIRHRIAMSMEVLDIDGEQEIFRLGERGDAAYFVEAGRVQLVLDDVTVATRAEGEIVGEFALIDRSPRSATARAHGPTRLVRWPREAFLQTLSLHPSVGMGLFRLLTTKLREDISRQVDFAVEQERWRIEMQWARDVQQGLLPAGEVKLSLIHI